MGKAKITIKPISKHRDKQMTFYKRKKGLLKKAIELAVLCETRVFLAFYDNLSGRFSSFQSHELTSLAELFKTAPPRLYELFTPKDYSRVTGGEQLGDFQYNYDDAFDGVGDKARRVSKIEQREVKHELKLSARALRPHPASHPHLPAGQQESAAPVFMIETVRDLMNPDSHNPDQSKQENKSEDSSYSSAQSKSRSRSSPEPAASPDRRSPLRFSSSSAGLLGSAFKPVTPQKQLSISNIKTLMKSRLNIGNLPVAHNSLSRQDLLTAPVHYMSPHSFTTPQRNQRTSIFERVFNPMRSSAETPEPLRYASLVSQLPLESPHPQTQGLRSIKTPMGPPPPLYGYVIDSNSPMLMRAVTGGAGVGGGVGGGYGTPGPVSVDERWRIPTQFLEARKGKQQQQQQQQQNE